MRSRQVWFAALVVALVGGIGPSHVAFSPAAHIAGVKIGTRGPTADKPAAITVGVTAPGVNSTTALPLPVTPPLSAFAPKRDLACGPTDKPETGIQGDVALSDQMSGRAAQGYNCGIDVVGYNSLGSRGNNGNMAWVGNCAYVAGDGVAVVDVSNPAAPQLVKTLHTAGSQKTLETITAGTYNGRSILVAGRYGLFIDFELAKQVPVDVYDVTDCTHPKLMSTIMAPTSVHNLTLSPDLTQLWSTLPLQAFDISNPSKPHFLGNLENQIRKFVPTRLEFAHDVEMSKDGHQIYFGGQVVGDQMSMIVDITNWPNQPARIVANYAEPGHSIDRATINGKPYLIQSDESVVGTTAVGCAPTPLTPFGGASYPIVMDISDPAHPKDVGEAHLAINRAENCVDQIASGVDASTHYTDVDDPDATTFVMASSWNAGLRIFDVRNPTNPKEVAYLNPGQFGYRLPQGGPTPLDPLNDVTSRSNLDQAWAHIRYIPTTGQLWFSTRTGGFWVLQLQPQIRAQLGLPAMSGLPPLAGSPRPFASRSVPASSNNAPAYYCMFASLGI